MEHRKLQNLTQDELIDFICEMERQFQTSSAQTATFIEELESLNQKLLDTQSRLIHTAKLSALGTVASGIVHDLKNPLQILFMALELLVAQRYVKEDGKPLIKQMEMAIDRMTQIIKKLQSLARKGVSEEEFEIINLCEVVENSFILQKYDLHDRDISWVIEKKKNRWMILGDKTELQSVFENLISNSKDAFKDITDNRKKQIQIIFNEGGEKTKILFKDNAGGIPEDVTKRIFEPFYTTKTELKGTGLGLANCNDIIKRHGGYIEVSSVVGDGTTFEVVIPTYHQSKAPQ